jgi:hypothetical protein
MIAGAQSNAILRAFRAFRVKTVWLSVGNAVTDSHRQSRTGLAKRCNHPIEFVIRGERQLGGMIKAAKESGQIREGNPTGSNQFGTVVTRDSSPTLDDLGISRDLSSRAQKTHAIPEAKFEEIIEQKKPSAELSRARVLPQDLKPAPGMIKTSKECPSTLSSKPDA